MRLDKPREKLLIPELLYSLMILSVPTSKYILKVMLFLSFQLKKKAFLKSYKYL